MRRFVSITSCKLSHMTSPLRSYEALHRAAANDPDHGTNMVREPVLDQADHLTRDLLRAPRTRIERAYDTAWRF